MDISINNIVVLVNLSIIVISVLLVLFYSRNKGLKITYIIFDIGLLTWLITLLLYYSSQFETYLLIIGRLNFVGLLIASIGYYFFIRIFTKKDNIFKWNTTDIIITILSSILIPLTIATPFVAIDEIVLADGARETIYGLGYYIYLLIFFINLIVGLVVSIKNYKSANPQLQKQIKIFLVSIFISITVGGFTNILLPLMGIFEFQPYGSLALIILNVAMVFLIIRYQFLNIRILLGRLTYFLLIQTFLLTTFYIANVLIDMNIVQYIPAYRIIVPFVITLPATLVFDTLNTYMKKQMRTRFINPGYDPYEVIDEFNKKVLTSTNLDEISEEFVNTIQQTLRPSSIKMQILNDHTPTQIEIEILEYFNKFKLQAITYNHEDNYTNSDLQFIHIYEYMQKFDIRLICPISNQSKILGYVKVGKKDLDSLYTQYDIEFLMNLVGIISLSITRAQLYQEVQDLNSSLQQKVDLQTSELQQKIQQLEASRKKERDMIDIMGHELRTPMSVIKLNTDLLHHFTINVTQKKESFVKYVSRIKESVETEIKLINTLLSSAKLEGDRIELNYEKVNLSKQITMSLHAHEMEAKHKGLQLITKLSPKATYIYADHARMVEILNNLIDNAVKYTEEGNITVKTEEESNFVKISVIDTGRGLSDKDLSRLGDKFFRTKNYIESEQSDDIDIVRPGGTGLGLYVTFNLIKKMGGKVEVKSKLGEGSNFSFTIPKYTGQVTKKRTDTKDMFSRLGLNVEKKR